MANGIWWDGVEVWHEWQGLWWNVANNNKAEEEKQMMRPVVDSRQPETRTTKPEGLTIIQAYPQIPYMSDLGNYWSLDDLLTVNKIVLGMRVCCCVLCVCLISGQDSPYLIT